MRVLPLALVCAVGCAGADSDNDGLSNHEEEALGTDPNRADSDDDGLLDGAEVDAGADPLSADTDGDGLLDGAEIEAGADPTVIDTDGDGYTDRDEVAEQRDPADASSVIYQGGWPYVFDKDSLPTPSGPLAEIGQPFARLKMKDQFGDDVDLYDFYNADKPIVIDISAAWCGPCNGLGLYLDGKSEAYGFAEMWPAGPDVVSRGDVYWLTILGEDSDNNPAKKPDATDWYREYKNDAVVVLADDSYEASEFVALTAWPTVLLLEPDLTISADPADWWAEYILPVLNDRYPQ